MWLEETLWSCLGRHSDNFPGSSCTTLEAYRSYRTFTDSLHVNCISKIILNSKHITSCSAVAKRKNEEPKYKSFWVHKVSSRAPNTSFPGGWLYCKRIDTVHSTSINLLRPVSKSSGSVPCHINPLRSGAEEIEWAAFYSNVDDFDWWCFEI